MPFHFTPMNDIKTARDKVGWIWEKHRKYNDIHKSSLAIIRSVLGIIIPRVFPYRRKAGIAQWNASSPFLRTGRNDASRRVSFFTRAYKKNANKS